jgi:uncharacterized protein YbaR (Trm112 family)
MDAIRAEINELPEFLLDMLVCPVDNQPLMYLPEEGVLYNERLRKSYPIVDSIPVMLEEESSDVNDEQHAQYIQNAQRITGSSPSN